MVILLSDKIYLNSKTVTSYRTEYLIMIEEPVHQDYVTGIKAYMSNTRAPKCMKQKQIEFNEKIVNVSIIVRVFHALLLIIKQEKFHRSL